MKRVLLGLAIAGTAAFAAPQASAEPFYCDATFRPSCEQCLPIEWTFQPICVRIDVLPEAG